MEKDKIIGVGKLIGDAKLQVDVKLQNAVGSAKDTLQR